jgi:hypothetical protein
VSRGRVADWCASRPRLRRSEIPTPARARAPCPEPTRCSLEHRPLACRSERDLRYRPHPMYPRLPPGRQRLRRPTCQQHPTSPRRLRLHRIHHCPWDFLTSRHYRTSHRYRKIRCYRFLRSHCLRKNRPIRRSRRSRRYRRSLQKRRFRTPGRQLPRCRRLRRSFHQCLPRFDHRCRPRPARTDGLRRAAAVGPKSRRRRTRRARGRVPGSRYSAYTTEKRAWQPVGARRTLHGSRMRGASPLLQRSVGSASWPLSNRPAEAVWPAEELLESFGSAASVAGCARPRAHRLHDSH